MTTSVPETVRLGVGIDTARYGHHVSFLTEDREPAIPAMTISESSDGYRKLRQELDRLQGKYPHAHFHVHIDAAGQYATNLEQFLRDLEFPMTVSVGEPKRNKDYHQVFFPKRKADPTESHAMARFAVVEQPACTERVCDEIHVLREIAGRLEAQVKSTTQAINRLHNLMARVFPELAIIAPNIAAAWVLQLLVKYPTPERIARAALSSLIKIRHITKQKAHKIQTAAKESVGSLRGELTEELVRQAVAQVQSSQQAERKLEELLLSAFHALPRTGHVQVETISGIGAVTAAILVAKIVSIDRFLTAEKLVGYFGVFPEEHSSGVDRNGRPLKRTKYMSRKGNDLVRRYLFCAARSAMRHNPAVRALYARLRARGTRGDVALGHCMRKLLHLVFAVWVKDQPFNKNYYPWEPTKEAWAESSPSPEPKESQEEAAGLKRDVLPARKEVTAANSKVDHTTRAVNDEQSAPVEVSVNRNEENSPRGSVDYAWLRSQITIEQVLRHLGHFDCLRGKTQLSGPCPLHNPSREGSRSFSVNLQKNAFRCLNPGCAAQGNALDLWAACHGLTLHPAALHLADTFHLEIKPEQRRLPWGIITPSVSAYFLRTVLRRFFGRQRSDGSARPSVLSAVLTSPSRHSGT